MHNGLIGTDCADEAQSLLGRQQARRLKEGIMLR